MGKSNGHSCGNHYLRNVMQTNIWINYGAYGFDWSKEEIRASILSINLFIIYSEPSRWGCTQRSLKNWAWLIKSAPEAVGSKPPFGTGPNETWNHLSWWSSREMWSHCRRWRSCSGFFILSVMALVGNNRVVNRSKNEANREATTDDLSEGDLEQLLLENCAIFIINWIDGSLPIYTSRLCVERPCALPCSVTFNTRV